ncbi:MAG TPA: adenylate/guanylate cyclase domain-containing protein [Stellaceae bacterium]|nr:adenylate/guanylate cyclase domain-containing protein [Stellaceae bacterium]
MTVMPSQEPQPAGTSAALRAGPVIEWLVRAAREVTDVVGFLATICEHIVAAGIPLERSSIHMRLLHPEIRGYTLLWRHGRGAEITPRYHGVENLPTYTNSPIYWIYGGAERFRRRLESPDVMLDFAVLAELKAEAFTDYVAQRLPFTDGSNHGVTWATLRPGGFSDEDLAFLDALVPHIGVIFEARATHYVAETLLSVYLGADAGKRVLSGQITRGSGQVIEAAILFADMRGFTEISEHLRGDEVIELLNQYFEAVIAPVEDHSGQVLKLIGDGMLAIFPLQAGGARPACLAAYSAAKAAFANITEMNRRRRGEGKLTVRIGITFHIGPVIYGNIGGASRLDFTVIGPAVNLVSRLQRLCRDFGKGMLMSAEFAAEVGLPVVSLGHHALRGMREPPEVFALPLAEDPYHDLAPPR